MGLSITFKATIVAAFAAAMMVPTAMAQASEYTMHFFEGDIHCGVQPNGYVEPWDSSTEATITGSQDCRWFGPTWPSYKPETPVTYGYSSFQLTFTDPNAANGQVSNSSRAFPVPSACTRH